MKKTMIFLTIVALFFSCRKEVELKMNDKSHERLIVDASISDSAMAHRVKLTLSSEFNNPEEPRPAREAKVTITDGENTETLVELSPGEYFTNHTWKGITGHTYHLTIEYGGTTYRASCLLRAIMPIEYIYTLPDDEDMSADTTWMTFGSFFNPATRDEYAVFHYYINGKLQSDTLMETQLWTDEYMNGQQYDGPLTWGVKAKTGDTITVKISSAPKEYAEWLMGVGSSMQMPIPFIGSPPANAFGNIDNGALGFFLATSSTSASCVVMDYSLFFNEN